MALPPTTVDNCVIFAKNADRPPTEVQEVIYVPAADHSEGSKLHVRIALRHASFVFEPLIYMYM